MAKKTAPLLPQTAELLSQLGERLRLARLRRRITAKQLAERAGMTAVTLRGLERGGSGVTIGAYLAVMQVLGVESDLNLIAKADPMGRELQDTRMLVRRKVSKPTSISDQIRKATSFENPLRNFSNPLSELTRSSPLTELDASGKTLGTLSLSEEIRKATSLENPLRKMTDELSAINAALTSSSTKKKTPR